MLGPQHRSFNISFSILAILTLICAFKFNMIFLLSIPIGVFVYSFPDIDAQSVPKRWKTIKNLWIAVIFSIFLIALVATCYFGYNIFIKKVNFDSTIQYFGLAVAVLIIYINGYRYAKSSHGHWLTAHRGFTHRLIMVIIPMLVFYQLDKLIVTANEKQLFLIRASQVALLGLSVGILGHQILDLTCKVGIRGWLWPILPKTTISIGSAISSDPKRPRQPHKSSVITTKFMCLICYILIIVLIWYYKDYLLELLKTFKKF